MALDRVERIASITMKEESPKPPPYAFDSPPEGKKTEAKEAEVKIEIPTKAAQKAKKETIPEENFLNFLLDVYMGDVKSCPLTCGLIPARVMAWVLALLYTWFHGTLIIKLREPRVPADQRGLVTIVAAIHAICMTAAFIGICRKRPGLMVPFIFVQFAETALLTVSIAIWFCVPVLNIAWCLVSGDGEPFGMFTKVGMEAFAFCALLTVGFHLFLAVFIRAAMASLSNNSRGKR